MDFDIHFAERGRVCWKHLPLTAPPGQDSFGAVGWRVVTTWRIAMQRSAKFAALLLVLGSGWLGVHSKPAAAASHLWRIHEVFSNPDGTIQYIVLHECCGAAQEIFLQNLEVTTKVAGKVFRFPRNIAAPSSRKYLLLATQGFAELPGAPAPDFIIPDGLFAVGGDTIWYSEARNYDRFRFVAGDLPLDGRRAIRVVDYVSDRFVAVENAPINYQGITGTVDASAEFVRGDCNEDSQRNLSDVVFMLNSLFLGASPLACEDACDSNDDGTLDVSDAVGLILFLFLEGTPLPAPTECGEDPTSDPNGCTSFASCV